MYARNNFWQWGYIIKQINGNCPPEVCILVVGSRLTVVRGTCNKYNKYNSIAG